MGSLPTNIRKTFWRPSVLILVANILLTMALYGASLRYGFLLDDAMDLPRASGRTYTEILTSAGDSAYFRPVVFILWKALYDFIGRHDPVVLHSICLVLQVLNGWLVYLVTTHLTGRLAGAVAMLLFSAFPFGYQSVSHINSVFHLVVAACTLTALLLYLVGRSRPSLAWLSGSLLLAAIGCFTHEYGIAIVVVIALFESRELVQGQPARWAWLAGFVVLAASYGWIWWAIPKWQTTWAFNLPNFQVNAAYLAQGLLFPVAGWLPLAPRVLALGSEAVIVVATAVFLAAVLLVSRFTGRSTLALVAVAWYLAAVFPAMLLLNYHTYLVDAPRLMYFAAAPAALAWAILATAWGRRIRLWRLPDWALPALLAMGLAWPGVDFITDKAALMSLGGQASDSLAGALSAHQNQSLMIANFPSWMAPRKDEHLLGHTGYSLLPDYIGIERLAYIVTGQQRVVTSVAVPSLSSRTPYNLGLHGRPINAEDLSSEARAADLVYLTEYATRTITLRWVGGRPLDFPALAVCATFGDWVRLEGVQYWLEGDIMWLELIWRPLATPSKDYTLFVHVYGLDGNPVAQADGYPLAGMAPPRLWQPGDPILDRRRLVLPPGLPAGEYTLAAGWYDRANGDRAVATSPAGERLRDDVLILGRIPK